MKQFTENPQKILSSIKTSLSNAVKDRKHGFHLPIFTNLTKNGGISSRIVVLRKFNPNNNLINFHTDKRSKKISELTKNPKTYFVFYDFKEKIQLRLNTISKVNYKNQVSSESWEKTKLSSRKCYLSKKKPGSISNIAEDGIEYHLIGVDPKKNESELGYKNFAVIENKIISIDWLYLSSSGHRRLSIKLDNKDVEFNWIIP